ncbi:hypothetical protein D3C84_1047960 [compost metagenome]
MADLVSLITERVGHGSIEHSTSECPPSRILVGIDEDCCHTRLKPTELFPELLQQ